MKIARILACLVVAGLGSVGSSRPARADYTLKTLVTFTGLDGFRPQAGVTIDAMGNLYGTTSGGGDYGGGTVYEIAAGTSTLKNLANLFTPTSGVDSLARVTLDSRGILYGTTSGGGINGGGTVFQVDPASGNFSTIANLGGSNSNIGASPTTGVTLDGQGNLFGTTKFGLGNSQGTVYEVAAGSHAITTVANFTGANGGPPSSGLVMDAQGNLYGTTSLGGDYGQGTIFKIAAGTGVLSTIFSFHQTINNGGVSQAVGDLAIDAQGNLYGAAGSAPGLSGGAVYKFSTITGSFTTLANFTNDLGGSFSLSNPVGGVTLDAQGNIYGTLALGGANNGGAVYEFNGQTGVISLLALLGGSAGNEPLGGVTFDAQGNLYGTTASGNGPKEFGTVFELVNNNAAVVPEPGSWIALGQAALAGLGLAFRSRSRSGR